MLICSVTAVGRWQQNRDLSWYAKGDESSALSAAEARKEEIRRVKEAEQNALSEALGYGPMPTQNPNEVAIGSKEVAKAIKESTNGVDDGAKGVGYGAFTGGAPAEAGREVLGGLGIQDELGDESRPRRREGDGGREGKRRRSRSRRRLDHRDKRHRRSLSGDRSRERRHRRHQDHEGRSHGEKRSRSQSREQQRSHRRERSRSDERRRDVDRYSHSRPERNYPPDPPRRRHYSRDRDRDRERDYNRR